MFCTECGEALDSDAKFCNKCGTGTPDVSRGSGGATVIEDRPGTIASHVAAPQTPSPARRALSQKQTPQQLVVAAVVVVAGLWFVAGGKDTVSSWFHHVAAGDAAAEIIKKNLKSPSTFALVSERQVWAGKGADGKDAFIFHVDYDAQNGFGAMIRGSTYVAYEISGDQYEWNPGMAMDSSPESMESLVVEMLRKLNFEK